MHPVRQEDDEHAGRRIDPNRRAGKARVSERSDREQFAAIRRERRVDVPAEPASVRLEVRSGGARHLLDGERRQDARALQCAAAEQHSAEDGQIGGRAKETRVSGDAAHATRGWIVHDAAQHRHVGALTRPAEARAALRRRDARRERRRWVEGCVAHAERLEDTLACEPIERHATDALNDVAEEKEVDIAVDEALAGT